MPLNPCRECDHEVSREAEACPNCGAKWPGDKLKYWGEQMSSCGCALTLLITLPFLALVCFGM